MSTRAQRKANRRNASNSTGPVTDAGKIAASQNARTHGFSSLHFSLQPGEDPNDFGQLVQRLTQEMKVASEHESFLVTLMAQARWKRTRIQAHEMALLDQLLAGEPVEARLALMMRYAADAERAYYKAHRECAQSRLQRHREQQADFDEAVAVACMSLPGQGPSTLAPITDLASFRNYQNSAQPSAFKSVG